jgi:hypothetical protein
MQVIRVVNTRQIALAIGLFRVAQLMAIEKYLLMHYTLYCLIASARQKNLNRKISEDYCLLGCDVT